MGSDNYLFGIRARLRIYDSQSKQGRIRQRSVHKTRTIPRSKQRIKVPNPQPQVYRNPFRSIRNLQPERVDQGVDYGGTGPVYPLGSAVVTNLYNSGWPGGSFISYRLTDGPQSGSYVYVAENVTPKVKIGQRVTPNTVLGILNGALETGWAAPPGTGMSLAHKRGHYSFPTPEGQNFNKVLMSTGAPSGTSPGKGTGQGPSGGGGNVQTTGIWGDIAGGILGAPVKIVAGSIASGIGAGFEDAFIALWNQLFKYLIQRVWWTAELGAGLAGVFIAVILLVVAGIIKGLEGNISYRDVAGAVAAAPETGGASLLLGGALASRQQRQARQQAQLDQAAQRIVIASQRQETQAAREARLTRESDAAMARSVVSSSSNAPDRTEINKRINERLARIRAQREAKNK